MKIEGVATTDVDADRQVLAKQPVEGGVEPTPEIVGGPDHGEEGQNMSRIDPGIAADDVVEGHKHRG